MLGIGAAYHLSQAVGDNASVTDEPLKAVILEARDFCTWFNIIFNAPANGTSPNRFGGDWSVLNDVLLSCHVVLTKDWDVGRNGGHLTPRVFEGFVSLQQKYGDSQALKSIALEHYTVDVILKIVQDHNLTDEIDLDALGRIKLFITEREILEAKANLHAAGEAGVDLSKTEWINEHDMNEVCAVNFPEELVWI